MTMSLFHHDQEPANPSKRCKFLKDALASCHAFCRKISSQEDDDDDDLSDYEDEQEIFVSAVLSQYKESKSKRNAGLTVDNFIWGFDFDFSPTNRKEITWHANASDDDEERDEFYSPCSRLSRSSSAKTAEETFMSVKTNLSRCSSMSSIEVPISRRRRRRQRSIILELWHCEGWPFGLCRKALLVPPLPKSPSESWMWRKTTRLVKIKS